MIGLDTEVVAFILRPRKADKTYQMEQKLSPFVSITISFAIRFSQLSPSMPKKKDVLLKTFIFNLWDPKIHFYIRVIFICFFFCGGGLSNEIFLTLHLYVRVYFFSSHASLTNVSQSRSLKWFQRPYHEKQPKLPRHSPYWRPLRLRTINPASSRRRDSAWGKVPWALGLMYFVTSLYRLSPIQRVYAFILYGSSFTLSP